MTLLRSLLLVGKRVAYINQRPHLSMFWVGTDPSDLPMPSILVLPAMLNSYKSVIFTWQTAEKWLCDCPQLDKLYTLLSVQVHTSQEFSVYRKLQAHDFSVEIKATNVTARRGQLVDILSTKCHICPLHWRHKLKVDVPQNYYAMANLNYSLLAVHVGPT